MDTLGCVTAAADDPMSLAGVRGQSNAAMSCRSGHRCTKCKKDSKPQNAYSERREKVIKHKDLKRRAHVSLIAISFLQI